MVDEVYVDCIIAVVVVNAGVFSLQCRNVHVHKQNMLSYKLCKWKCTEISKAELVLSGGSVRLSNAVFIFTNQFNGSDRESVQCLSESGQ